MTNPREGWIGPLFGWELLRLGRRGGPVLGRVLVALLLLAALWIVYRAQFPEKALRDANRIAATKELTEFAETFAMVFLLAQLGVVALLTPILVAGSIIEEKDRKTLEFLLSSDLSSREIILGKYLSRMGMMLCLLLSGMPVLAITQVWGGVDWLLIVIGYAFAVASMLLIGGISAACAVGAASLRRALLLSYGPMILITGWFVNILLDVPKHLPQLHQWDWSSWAIVAISMVIALNMAESCVRAAVRRMRRAAHYYSPKPSGTRFRAAPTARLHERKRHWADPPPMGDHPLWWKERYFGGGTNRFLRLLGLVPAWLWVAVVTTVAMVLLNFLARDHVYETANAMTRLGGLALLAILVTGVGLSAAGSVAKERQQQTMTDLLMVPQPRRDLLKAKWFASMHRGLGVGCGILALILFGLIIDGIAILAAPLLLVAMLAFAAFASSLGLYLSVRCRTVMRASNAWMLAMILLLASTYLATEALQPGDPRSNPVLFTANDPYDVTRTKWDRILHPVYTWQQFAFRQPDDAEYAPWYERKNLWGKLYRYADLLPAMVGILLYAALAFLLWRAALWRFRREGSR